LTAAALQRLNQAPMQHSPVCRSRPCAANLCTMRAPQVGETEEGLPPLERLLRCDQEAAHLAIADALWEAPSDADAVAALTRMAGADLAAWEAEGRAGRGARGEGGRSGDDEQEGQG
jgi:tRNA-dihydrouridine synthase 3